VTLPAAATAQTPAVAPPDAGAAGTSARFLALAEAVGALLHETQRERGLSTLVAGSRGRLLARDLERQWRRTEARRSGLQALLDEHAMPGAVRRRFERAEKLLSPLGSLRAGVKAREVGAPQVIEAYTAVNTELLAVTDAFMVAGAMGGGPSHALACVALLYAKEKTGVERAQLANVFLEDRFADQQRLSVAALLAAQSSYFHIFSAAAPRAADQLLRRALASPAATEVQRMEGVVLDGESDHGFGIDPVVWFEAMTRKIEMLAGVSRTVITMLREGLSTTS
jgi:methyl-accepting chemotaxis protein